MTNVTIPDSVTSIGSGAFSGCTGLTGVYFQGQAPVLPRFGSIFDGVGQMTVYYLPGSTGWDSTFNGRPTALWLLQVRTAAGITYSRLIEGLKAAKCTLDRKVIADIAAQDNAAFGELVKLAQSALKTKSGAAKA